MEKIKAGGIQTMKVKFLNGTRLILSLVFIFILFFVPAGQTVRAFNLKIQSKAALLMEPETGEIIFACNEHERLYPASITKIMTLLLALEDLNRGEIKLEDKVLVSDKASSMGGSEIFLSSGDVVDLESLLIGITVGSANDAAVAVAEHIAGSEEVFVERMNRRAAELGMGNTNFVNCTGLHHDRHTTTAYDVALMSREIINCPMFFNWSKIWMDENFLEGKIKSGKVFLSNTNRLIFDYRYCDGIKTGFTRQSGHSISATAKKEDTRFIAVVLNAPSSEIRYEEAINLLNFGFANYEHIPLAAKKEKVARLPVEKGSVKEIDILVSENLSLLVKKGEELRYTTETFLPEKLEAPLPAGSKVGKIKVTAGEKTLQEVDLEVVEDVRRASLPLLFSRYLKMWLKFGR
jgi:D-alanyl-D-alanine carboxypeptidase (penicillin-binding protein 5/6)